MRHRARAARLAAVLRVLCASKLKPTGRWPRPARRRPQPTSPPKPSCGGAETLTRRRGSEPVLASTGGRLLGSTRRASLQTGHVALQAAYAPTQRGALGAEPRRAARERGVQERRGDVAARLQPGAGGAGRGAEPDRVGRLRWWCAADGDGAGGMTATFQRVKTRRGQGGRGEHAQRAHVLKRLQPSAHPAIANVVEVLEAEKTTHVALEYCAGGSPAASCSRRARLRVAATVIGQVASALRHLHAAACHRDVKPENVLYVDGACTRVKLCDFGFAVICSSDRRLKTVCGRSVHGARDLARRSRRHLRGSSPWSLGALAAEALHGHAAFRGSSMEQLKMRVLRADHDASEGAFGEGARPPRRTPRARPRRARHRRRHPRPPVHPRRHWHRPARAGARVACSRRGSRRTAPQQRPRRSRPRLLPRRRRRPSTCRCQRQSRCSATARALAVAVARPLSPAEYSI